MRFKNLYEDYCSFQVVVDYADVADFIFIYTTEAHPVDGLAMETNPYIIKQHTNIGNSQRVTQRPFVN